MRAPKVPGIPGAPRPAKHNQTNRNTKESRQREKLLDTSKANYFKYDLQDMLKASPVAPELHNSLIQTLWAKGTRDSTQEAKVWLNDKVKEKQVDVATQQKILIILDRFSTWR
ncbi:MAG: hypothetical protein QOG31_752 [Thermoplasmata archaeon]|jgi:hypothetical protein|nr:hypothetical protein [Thermoplasmata archaeon]